MCGGGFQPIINCNLNANAEGGAILSQFSFIRIDLSVAALMIYFSPSARIRGSVSGDPQFHTKSKSRLVSITEMTTRTSDRKQPLIMCLAYPKYDRLMIWRDISLGVKGRAVLGSTPSWLFVPPPRVNWEKLICRKSHCISQSSRVFCHDLMRDWQWHWKVICALIM